MNNKSLNSIRARMEKLRKEMAKNGFDAALITKRENYMYMSGFTGTSAFLIITQKDAVLVTDFRYDEQATRQAPFYEVVKYQGSITAALEEQIKSRNIRVLGFEESAVTYERYAAFKERLGAKEFVPLKGIIENLRMKKDKNEIDIIQKAVKIADNAFEHILGYIKPGITEMEIAAEIEYFMKKHGATGASFETIVASGKRSSMPHGVASDKKLEPGDTITLDYGALYNGYCSDITRTVFLGNPDEELKRIYKIVLDAQLRSIEGACKGITGRQVDLIARKIISTTGYGQNFGHGLGHGVGLEIHEEPRFAPSGSVVLDNGMVVTVEPGIYVAGLGGVRIEDIIVISNDKPINLTGASKELIVL
jgi:Xaa-Pro aminopeptidase